MAIWVWLIPIVCRFIFLGHERTYFPDSNRFVTQAESLLAGNGYPPFEQFIKLVSAPPPGYPVFIAAAYSIVYSDTFLVFCQCLLSIVSCYLLYLALKPRSPLWANIVLISAATCPITGRLMVTVLSETLSIFLGSVVVFCLSRIEFEKANRRIGILAGLCIAGLMLTTPAAVPLGYALLLYVLWKKRHTPRFLAVVFLAWMIPVIPWQIDCVRRTGNIQPHFFYLLPNSGFTNGFTQWFRTWNNCCNLEYFWEGPGYLAQLPPEHAFANTGEKALVLDWAAKAASGELPLSEYDKRLGELAKLRVQNDPWNTLFLVTLRRAVHDWNPITLFPLRGSLLNPKPQEAYLILHQFFQLFLWVLFAFMALRGRHGLPLLILFCTFLFVGLSSFSGLGEWRRNLPFFPFLFFLGCWAVKRIPAIGFSGRRGTIACVE